MDRAAFGELGSERGLTTAMHEVSAAACDRNEASALTLLAIAMRR